MGGDENGSYGINGILMSLLTIEQDNTSFIVTHAHKGGALQMTLIITLMMLLGEHKKHSHVINLWRMVVGLGAYVVENIIYNHCKYLTLFAITNCGRIWHIYPN